MFSFHYLIDSKLIFKAPYREKSNCEINSNYFFNKLFYLTGIGILPPARNLDERGWLRLRADCRSSEQTCSDSPELKIKPKKKKKKKINLF